MDTAIGTYCYFLMAVCYAGWVGICRENDLKLMNFVSRVNIRLIILNLPHYSLVTVRSHFLNDRCRSFLNFHRICYVE